MIIQSMYGAVCWVSWKTTVHVWSCLLGIIEDFSKFGLPTCLVEIDIGLREHLKYISKWFLSCIYIMMYYSSIPIVCHMYFITMEIRY